MVDAIIANHHYMNLHLQEISIPLSASHKNAIDNLVQKYPYFAVPTIIQALNEGQGEHSHHYFNTNAVMMHFLKQELSQHRLIPNDEPIDSEDIIDASTSLADIMEPISAQDYFAGSNITISDDMPNNKELAAMHNSSEEPPIIPTDKALLIQMKFEEWLLHISYKKRKEKEDLEEQEALKLKWKQQKLADAIQEENDDIPEEVFKMAVDSIEREESLVSESLANVYAIQGKKEQAISMYKKLILQNPQKKAYFADKIQQLNKDIQ